MSEFEHKITKTGPITASENQVEKKNPSPLEQLRIEEKKFLNTLYGQGQEKLNEIKKKYWEIRDAGIWDIPIDWEDLQPENPNTEVAKTLAKINKQIDTLVPPEFKGEINPQIPIKDQRIPSYMLIVNGDASADYNPYHKPPLLSKEGRHWILNDKKPDDKKIKRLQAHYTKAKAAEAVRKPA